LLEYCLFSIPKISHCQAVKGKDIFMLSREILTFRVFQSKQVLNCRDLAQSGMGIKQIFRLAMPKPEDLCDPKCYWKGRGLFSVTAFIFFPATTRAWIISTCFRFLSDHLFHLLFFGLLLLGSCRDLGAAGL
jgi:hypothetical protein